MVPVLLKALGDPNKNTEAALDKLLSTAFIHYIDGPSLALVVAPNILLILGVAHYQPRVEGTKFDNTSKVSSHIGISWQPDRSTRPSDLSH